MNVFSKITLESLKKNRMRTIVTIIGIMLSTALICAVTTTFTSMLTYGRNIVEYEEGSWHGGTKDITYGEYESIASEDKVKDAVFAKELGYSPINETKKYRSYIYMLEGNSDFFDMMAIRPTSGRLPENSDEIILSDMLNINYDTNYKLGDKVTFDIGSRWRDGIKLSIYDQNVEYNGSDFDSIDENYVPEKTKEYTIVGFFSEPNFTRTSIGSSAYVSSSFVYSLTGSSNEIEEDSTGQMYFIMKKPSDVYDFMEDNGIKGSTNNELLALYGASRYESFYKFMYGIAAVVIGLIMLGSIVLIYNAFSISVAERTKQFGLLSSIGATKKQIRRTVVFEGFAVSVVGIPLGIILGISGMAVTFHCISSLFSDIIGTDAKLRLVISPIAILAACLIAGITVFISAKIPSIRATRITAVEAIRMNSDIKHNKKHIRTPKIIYKVFGLPGMLAQKYFKRSKKRYRSTIISLFMSIVLFVASSGFTDYLVESAHTSFETTNCDIEVEISKPKDSDAEYDYDEILKKIESLNSVDKAIYLYVTGAMCTVPDEYVNPEIADDTTILGNKLMWTIMLFLDDDYFEEMLDENGLDRADYFDTDKPVGLVRNEKEIFDYDKHKFVKVEVFKNFPVNIKRISLKHIDGYYADYSSVDDQQGVAYYNDDGDELIEKRYPVSEVLTIKDAMIKDSIKSKPMVGGNIESGCLMFPYSMRDKLQSEEYNEYVSYCIKTDKHNDADRDLAELLDNIGIENYHITDYAEDEETARNIILIVKVFSYGFIILISLIAVANVFNTVNTNVLLRRREFAMLRSVGMSQNGIRRMLNYECIMYGTKALLYGLPASAGVTYLIYRATTNMLETSFRMPWKAVFIASFSVFAVVFATMLYSMQKIKYDNTVETLKNENI